MSDLIGRAAAIRKNQEVSNGIKFGECPFLIKVNTEKGSHVITDCKLEAFLHNLPSAQPEIILCKDCKHRPIATRADEGVLWGFSVEFPDEICPLQCEDGWYNYYPKDDFYCANAERRTDE